ncbi:MAG: zinc-binding alcohol dehydrogenase family protein [Chitinophagaceae bacterium]
MKAAVIFEKGGMPQYVDIPVPSSNNNDELLATVKAAAIKHLDKSKASGKHYSSSNDISKAKVIGGDGVGILKDGTRVYAMGATGMLAEKALIEKDRMVVLPASLDDITAAALPNAVAGSAMALLFRAGIQAGANVLINGATGFTGKIAVQLAKHYGANKVIATGRNEQTLKELLKLGADEIISLKQEDDALLTQLKNLHAASPMDIIVDYLWGHTAELILASLKGKGSFTHPTKFVSIGAVTGDIIQLSAENLRSVDLQLSGSGLGSWTKPQVGKFFTEILPEALQLAANGKLKVDTVSVKLNDIENLWDSTVPDGKRLVVVI